MQTLQKQQCTVSRKTSANVSREIAQDKYKINSRPTRSSSVWRNPFFYDYLFYHDMISQQHSFTSLLNSTVLSWFSLSVLTNKNKDCITVWMLNSIEFFPTTLSNYWIPHQSTLQWKMIKCSKFQTCSRPSPARAGRHELGPGMWDISDHSRTFLN